MQKQTCNLVSKLIAHMVIELFDFRWFTGQRAPGERRLLLLQPIQPLVDNTTGPDALRGHDVRLQPIGDGAARAARQYRQLSVHAQSQLQLRRLWRGRER